jgi:hypothetical protein
MARPRGFATWNPKPATIDFVGQIKTVLDEYEDYLPVTARQIFYRLVGEHGYDKTEQAYARLCETLVRARRAGMIPFASIRDDGTAGGAPQTYPDVAGFWDYIEERSKHYSRDRMSTQDLAIELWCEAGGMVPQLQRVAYPFSVPVYSTGGFSSVTVTHEIARRALQRDVPTVFMHCGDYDPSGESIFDSQAGDARMFVRQIVNVATTRDDPTNAIALGSHMGLDEDEVMRIVEGHAKRELIPVRVALTEEQVHENDLPTAPPKRSDTRSVNWVGQTCQLEAMPPDQLASTVDAAIEEQIDTRLYNEQVELEQADEDRIAEGIEKAREA